MIFFIEVLDAHRDPYSQAENPEIAKIRGDKPCIKILNKYDLRHLRKNYCALAGELREERGVKTITTSSDNLRQQQANYAAGESICSYKEGQPKAIKAMITGYTVTLENQR